MMFKNAFEGIDIIAQARGSFKFLVFACVVHIRVKTMKELFLFSLQYIFEEAYIFCVGAIFISCSIIIFLTAYSSAEPQLAALAYAVMVCLACAIGKCFSKRT